MRTPTRARVQICTPLNPALLSTRLSHDRTTLCYTYNTHYFSSLSIAITRLRHCWTRRTDKLLLINRIPIFEPTKTDASREYRLNFRTDAYKVPQLLRLQYTPTPRLQFNETPRTPRMTTDGASVLSACPRRGVDISATWFIALLLLCGARLEQLVLCVPKGTAAIHQKFIAKSPHKTTTRTICVCSRKCSCFEAHAYGLWCIESFVWSTGAPRW